VVIDTTTLDRLPPELIREGWAEAYKAGLVGDPTLAKLLGSGGGVETGEVVLRALAVKKALVDADPLDKGDRAFLNFGHTIGHAVEYASTLSHGESVAVGMVAATRVSEALLGFQEADDVLEAIAGMGLPVSASGLDRARVTDLIGRDKKRDGEGPRMVLLRAIGEPVLTPVTDDDLALGLTSIGL
jgi:3-dehydroquinate synthase